MNPVLYVADCLDCEARPTFSDYEDRSNWVGHHRVQTGHTVHCYISKPEER